MDTNCYPEDHSWPVMAREISEVLSWAAHNRELLLARFEELQR
jgi:hypothetical protein